MRLLRVALKAETRSHHDRVDALLNPNDLSSRTGLGRFLLMQAGALSVLEPIMDDPRYLPPPRQLDLVKADLETLSISAAPFASALVTDDLHPVGLTYVIAGSHFGNKVLKNNWAATTDPRVLLAGRFLCSVAMKDYWPRFSDYLRKSAFEPPERSRIIRSAKTCFRVFEEAFLFAMKNARHDEP